MKLLFKLILEIQSQALEELIIIKGMLGLVDV